MRQLSEMFSNASAAHLFHVNCDMNRSVPVSEMESGTDRSDVTFPR